MKLPPLFLKLTKLLTPAIVFFAVIFSALACGAVFISPKLVLCKCIALLSGGYQGEPIDIILFHTRLPRILLAGSVGSALATAGLASQTLFRNPLASPYIIGVSSGSALGAVAGMLLINSFTFFCFGVVSIFSVIVGFLTTAIVFFLGSRLSSFSNALLLCGVAIGAFCSSLTAIALYLAQERLQTIIFWMMGGFWRASWSDALIMFPVAMGGLISLMVVSSALDVSLAGDRSATDLGVNIKLLQKILLIVIAIQTAVAVSLAGVIGFVGLIIPHLLRIFTGAEHSKLILSCALYGALFMILADTLARTAAAPAEVPVGVRTPLTGAPVFLWLLHRKYA